MIKATRIALVAFWLCELTSLSFAVGSGTCPAGMELQPDNTCVGGTLIKNTTSVVTYFGVVAALVAAVSAGIALAITLLRLKKNIEIKKTVKVDGSAAEISIASSHLRLLEEYHAQGLSQSRVSFWLSLLFASVGFAIISMSIGLFLSQTREVTIEDAIKPTFALVAGIIIDAVSALFFVQSNKARQLMAEFFDKLRSDRKLEEALRLIENVSDSTIASRSKSIIALKFSDITLDHPVLEELLRDGDHSKGMGRVTRRQPT